MAFLIFAIKDNYRTANPLPTGKARASPCCTPCILNTDSAGVMHNDNLEFYGTVVSASHSESLAIGWTEAWHHGIFLDLFFGVIWLRAIKGKIPKVCVCFIFLLFFSLHETFFPGIFESILTQLLQGNLKVSFPLCMRKAHIYVLWIIANNITCF